MGELLPLERARALVLNSVRPLGGEPVALDATQDRVLAEEVASGLDVPPFDTSAMDGYAVQAGPAAELRLVGESRAGHPAAVTVEAGTAIRISTGAQLPDGATAVVPVERSEPGPDGAVRVPETSGGENIRRAGEDIRAGAVVLHAGTTIGPAEAGVLASVGRAEVSCGKRPRVALLVTGDELVEPGGTLEPGQIFSSNSFALAAQIERTGAELVHRQRVGDSADATLAALGRALDEADAVCVSGGVSVGPHDHVKGALAELGVEQGFWGVRLKPGKPTWFGTRGATLVFGLPGNPVSAMVTFQLFARPALRALQGAEPDRRGEAVLDEAIARSPRRDQAVRVRLDPAPDGWHARPTGDQGSHVLTSMLGAGGLALVAAGEGELAPGERVEVELL